MTEFSVPTPAQSTTNNAHTSGDLGSAPDWEAVVLDANLSRPCQAVIICTDGYIAPVRYGQTQPETGLARLWPVVAGQTVRIQAIKFATPVSVTPATMIALFNSSRLV